MADQDAMPQGRFIRTGDFENVYANNVGFEPSAWDLKVVFGQLDQSQGVVNVEQHTAVTLAWPEVKVLAFMLAASVLGYEVEHGKIKVPPGGLPTMPPLPTGEAANNPKVVELHNAVTKLYAHAFLDPPQQL
jgi:hypothetical protein